MSSYLGHLVIMIVLTVITRPSHELATLFFHLLLDLRTERGGGGVGIYLRHNIPGSVVSRCPNKSVGFLEYLLEIELHRKKKILFPIDKVNYFNALEDVLDSLFHQYEL